MALQLIANHENLIDSLSLPDFQNIINFLCSNGNGFDLSEPTFLKMLSCEKAEELSQTIGHVLEGLRSDAEKANESLITRLVEDLIEREQSYDEHVAADRPDVPVLSSQPSSLEDSSKGGQLDEKSPSSIKKSSTRHHSKAPKTKQRRPGKLGHDHKDEQNDSSSAREKSTDSNSGGEKLSGKRQTKQPASNSDTDHSAPNKSGKVKVTPCADGSSTNSHLDSRLADSVSASGGRSEPSEKLTPEINKGDLEERGSIGEDKESPKEAKTDSRQSKQSFHADECLVSKKGGKSQAKPPPASTDESSADHSLDSSKSHSESKSLDWFDLPLDLDSRHKFQLKKETELNFSLVLEDNLPPESLAKINGMLRYLSLSHPEVRVRLSEGASIRQRRQFVKLRQFANLTFRQHDVSSTATVRQLMPNDVSPTNAKRRFAN